MFKKLLVSIILSSLLFINLAFAPLAAKAAASPPPAPSSAPTWYNQSFQDWYSKVSDQNNPSEIFGERYTSAQVEWVIYGIFAFFINHLAGPDAAHACISGDTLVCTSKIVDFFTSLGKASGGASNQNQSLSRLIFADRPLSGISYIKDKVQNFSLVPVARAQEGFGFGALNPVVSLWRATRNFAYSLSIIAVIVLAFMIMFRVKISPQVVISVQSAIPKVIFALIFVTFSYAIAGLMIDLLYVVIGVLAFFIGGINGNPQTNFIFMTQGIPIIGGGFLGLMAMYFAIFFWVLLFTLFASTTNILTFLPLLPVIILIFLLIVIIAAVVLFFIAFKIFWLLLKTLAQTYLLVIFGPIQIILGAALPAASGVGTGAWIKSLAINLVVYPTVGLLFMLSFVFLFFSLQLGLGKALGGQFTADFLKNNLGVTFPFPTGGWAPPLTLGANLMPLVFLAISFVVLTIIPKTTEMIQAFLAGKPFGYGEAIGEAFATPWTLTRAAIAGRVGMREEERRNMGLEKHWTTRVLETAGIIR